MTTPALPHHELNIIFIKLMRKFEWSHMTYSHSPHRTPPEFGRNASRAAALTAERTAAAAGWVRCVREALGFYFRLIWDVVMGTSMSKDPILWRGVPGLNSWVGFAGRMSIEQRAKCEVPQSTWRKNSRLSLLNWFIAQSAKKDPSWTEVCRSPHYTGRQSVLALSLLFKINSHLGENEGKKVKTAPPLQTQHQWKQI